MIKVTKFDNKEIFINAELILYVEEKPDTIITLSTGEVIIVREKAEEIVERVLDYKKKIYNLKGR